MPLGVIWLAAPEDVVLTMQMPFLGLFLWASGRQRPDGLLRLPPPAAPPAIDARVEHLTRVFE
jgi:hypothetical protein